MAKSNQLVTWPVNSDVGPGARKESDVMTQVATAFDGAADLSVTAVSGAETGYQVDFYAQTRNVITDAFETAPPTSRMIFLGSITVDVVTMPLRQNKPRPFPHLATEYKIVAISSAATDTATIAANVRTDSP